MVVPQTRHHPAPGPETPAGTEDAQLVTPSQIAARFQVDERTVTRWLRNGYLRGFKLGKEWRVDPEDLHAFMEERVNRR